MTQVKTSAAPWRAVALPAEHGSWGLVLEPIILGLLVVPSAAGWALGLTAFAAFLLRQPARTLLSAARRGRATARTGYAQRFTAVYAVLFAASAGLTLLLVTRPGATGIAGLWPLLLALPSALIFIWFEWLNDPRHWLAEIGGAAAFAPLPATMALLAGADGTTALGLAVVSLARAWPSITYIRARIRLEKGKADIDKLRHDRRLVTLLGGAGLLAVGLLAGRGWLPWLALLPFVILLMRSVEGLSTGRRRLAIRTIGFMELGLGVLTVLLVAAGYW